MISYTAVRDFDYAVMAVSGLCFLLCLGTTISVLPWSRTLRQVHILVQFNIFWKIRTFLLLSGGFWLLAQWLRLDAIWEPGSQIMSPRVTDWAKEGWMCRIYLVISVGLLQPLFLLTALLLCRQSTSQSGATKGEWPNGRILCTAAIWTAPVFVSQLVIAFISLAFKQQVGLGHRKSVLHHFFAPYAVGMPQECGAAEEPASGVSCTRCAFPAASCIASVTLGACVLLLLLRATARMMRGVINRPLQRRIRIFHRTFAVALVIHEATQAVTTATSPFSWGFEVLWLASFLALPVLVAATCLPLALLPIWDTMSAGRAWQLAGGRYEAPLQEGALLGKPPRATVELNQASARKEAQGPPL
ncbi:hypothetical protein COCSUDRAFT_67942 [Coccomyxa subellipsoidea C-169]|uniref:Uncharacterized protein n=1 Tax=Coccomyxa subellipsoidea (strain C-169) TaxID=574566 RepID=I0YKW4_COCSC|nr:hypothetical protein COCSUDRAFT_67942 [Coccomyxa subellipsoidea C-169]EIE19033.1 hypothetical protein COCSUDRAFT_67942 [Coccomyxa subellipsoidea C-169]|eukprot:XP_005643577.1 hypothetical protein COCSUDRAFT_67942 [Coccomyxa subellipsoidea C-169]